jgi:hypothetical protein
MTTTKSASGMTAATGMTAAAATATMRRRVHKGRQRAD